MLPGAWAFARRLAGRWLRCGSFDRRQVYDLLALRQARLAGGAEVFRGHLVGFEEPEQGVDELARILPAVFPARQGFLAAAEHIRELVLGDSEAFAQGADVGAGEQAHVAGLGFVDEDGGFRRHHFIAERVGVHFDLDGVHLDRRPVFGGGDIDVEGDSFGFHVGESGSRLRTSPVAEVRRDSWRRLTGRSYQLIP